MVRVQRYARRQPAGRVWELHRPGTHLPILEMFPKAEQLAMWKLIKNPHNIIITIGDTGDFGIPDLSRPLSLELDPTYFTNFTEEEMYIMLAHELAHVHQLTTGRMPRSQIATEGFNILPHINKKAEQDAWLLSAIDMTKLGWTIEDAKRLINKMPWTEEAKELGLWSVRSIFS